MKKKGARETRAIGVKSLMGSNCVLGPYNVGITQSVDVEAISDV